MSELVFSTSEQPARKPLEVEDQPLNKGKERLDEGDQPLDDEEQSLSEGEQLDEKSQPLDDEEQSLSEGEQLDEKSQPLDGEQSLDEGEQSLDEEESSLDEGESSVDGEEPQQTREEQLALLIQEEEVTSDGEECELHVYERRYDTRGEKIYLRAGTKSKIEKPKRRSHRACLVLKRVYDFKGKLYRTELEIQSRHIIEALRNVIGIYGGVDFTSDFVTLYEPPRCLFHYQDELRRHAESSDNNQLKSHMQLCLEYMERVLDQEIKISKSYMSKKPMSPELEHRHLWMIFKPGCLVYQKRDDFERLLRLRSIFEVKDKDSDKIISWNLFAENIAFIGTEIGQMEQFIPIMPYDGCRPVCQLEVFPLHCHSEEGTIRNHLLKRGRKYLSLYGIHHCFYNGRVLIHTRTSTASNEASLLNRKVRQRIMIDAEEYQRNMRYFNNFIIGTKVYKSNIEAISNLSDEETMICHCRIPGYLLESKSWGEFLVDNVTEVVYNDTAFHHLVLAENKKELISSLLERQNHQQDDEFDDLIQGKGKGLIFLFYGPPGVGKTYTAESIADHTRRSLLKINSSELYRAGSWVEDRLSDLFSVATRWNSITLLDEADVFMQERSLHSLDTNQLVSMLLRVLEYFEGILFLTTNRVETIDHAFKSRIHLAIAYPPLSAGARRELWTTSIVRASHGQPPEWLTTDFLHHLARKKVNGREIKNIVRVGYSLARNAKRDMRSDDLLRGLDALEQFETDFSEGSEQKETRETIE